MQLPAGYKPWASWTGLNRAEKVAGYLDTYTGIVGDNYERRAGPCESLRRLLRTMLSGPFSRRRSCGGFTGFLIALCCALVSVPVRRAALADPRVAADWGPLQYGDYSPEDFHKWPPMLSRYGGSRLLNSTQL